MTTFTKRTVFGTYLQIDGTPRRGYIEFSPSTTIVRRGDAIIPVSLQTAVLDAAGHFSIDLNVTDDDTWIPNTWVWSVDEKMAGGKVWNMELPTGASPLDISTIIPVASLGSPQELIYRRMAEREARLAVLERR